jgi:hypothetical protein
MKVTVDNPRNEQFLPLAASLQLVKDRAHPLGDKRLILFSRGSSLLELPLAFEQGRFVDVSEDVLKWNVEGCSRTQERRLRNFDIGRDIGAICVGRVTGNFFDAARRRGFSNAELRFFAD